MYTLYQPRLISLHVSTRYSALNHNENSQIVRQLLRCKIMSAVERNRQYKGCFGRYYVAIQFFNQYNYHNPDFKQL